MKNKQVTIDLDFVKRICKTMLRLDERGLLSSKGDKSNFDLYHYGSLDMNTMKEIVNL